MYRPIASKHEIVHRKLHPVKSQHLSMKTALDLAARHAKENGVQYDLTHVHFHTPSEHSIGGKVFDLEVQLMHRNRFTGVGQLGVSLLYPGGRGLLPVPKRVPVTVVVG